MEDTYFIILQISSMIEAKKEGVVMSVTMVEGNKDNFSTLECTGENIMRKLQHIPICPGDEVFSNAINLIGNNSYCHSSMVDTKKDICSK